MTMNQGQLNFLRPQAQGPLPDQLPEQLPAGFLGVDTEHKGLGREAQAVGLSIADEAGGSWYLPFGHAEGVQHDPANVRRWAKDKLAGRHLVFRAAKNDLEVLRRWGVDLEQLGARPHEVAHPAALLDDRRRKFDLETLLQDELGIGKVELPFGPTTIWQQPPERVAEYARQDAARTLKLWQNYLPQISSQGLDKVLELEDNLIYCTLSMERTGCVLDMPKLERWDQEIKEEYNKRILEIYSRTKLRINPNSGDDLSRLFKYLGLPHTGHTTSGGAESFTDPVLEAVAGEWHGKGKERHFVVLNEVVHLAREARQLDSLRSKYTSKYLRGNIGGMLYFQLHQLRADDGGTITGRYASSGIQVNGVKMGGNIQQVSKPDKQDPVTQRWIIRELFLPTAHDDYLRMCCTVHDEVNATLNGQWFHADASQIEFRLMVHYTKSERLIKAYQENPDHDFHQLVTDEILENCMSRTLAKNFNFMKVYGGGVGKIMIMTGLDEVEATEMDNKYKQMFPEAGRLLDHATKVAETRKYVKTFLGRRRRYQPGDRFYSALNSVLQGTAADILKLKLLRLYNEHKSITNPQLAVECLAIQELPIRVPITWDADLGKNWYQVSPITELALERGDKEARKREGFLNP